MAVVNNSNKGIGIQIRGKVGEFGVPDPKGVFGIYQIRTRDKKQVQVKEKFYEPSDQTQPAKVARQQIFAAAVTAWQSLTPEQKKEYNIKAKYKPLSGYNLYLREYLLSH